MLELAYQVLENLGERAESAADFGIDSDNRDVENEAMVFIKEAVKIPNSLSCPDRVRNVWFRIHDAEEDLGKAIRNRRERLEGGTALEQFSHRRSRRVQSAWEVERRREKAQSEKTLERANVTSERVLDALQRALQTAASADVRPVDVAIALMSELADPSIAGRQRVVTRVGQVMRGLADEGRVQRIRPDDYDGGRRKPHRYAMPEVDDAR